MHCNLNYLNLLQFLLYLGYSYVTGAYLWRDIDLGGELHLGSGYARGLMARDGLYRHLLIRAQPSKNQQSMIDSGYGQQTRDTKNLQ